MPLRPWEPRTVSIGQSLMTCEADNRPGPAAPRNSAPRNWAPRNPTPRHRTARILSGAVLALVMAGCGMSQRRAPWFAPARLVASPDPERAVRPTVRKPDRIDERPRAGKGRSDPTEPGAEAVVRSILAALPARRCGPDRVIRVRLGLRNQSHGSRREFAALRERLARLLSRAASRFNLVFTAPGGAGGEAPPPGSEAPVDYRLRGAAYLVTADGIEHWELYLSLVPAAPGENWTVWRARGPVRVLRHPQPGRPQITLLRGSL